MYECPNCGGNLKFDIEAQLLKCDYCLTTKDPYEVTKDRDAEEHSGFDVTVFTCPECGGEILSTDNSAAEFCSFCGASTILDSRISKENRPLRIIPFKVTKDACKKAYINRMKRAIFAPNELKEEKYINSFRGIYMPYWVYNISQKGEIHLTGKKSFRRGDYIYTDYYDLGGQIDAHYNDISYDASSSFSDAISERIAPYNIRDEKPFTPSFLSGFYADTADVPSSLYRGRAEKLANDASLNSVKRTATYSGLTISATSPGTALCTQCAPPERVMYPVWFMSYRRGDRVAYTTINGQTGKIAADVPIDIKKYLLGTFILALPIFLLFNMLFTITAQNILFITMMLALGTFIVFTTEISKICAQDRRSDDAGYQYEPPEEFPENNSADGQNPSSKPKPKSKKKKKDSLSFNELLSYASLSVGTWKIPGFLGSLIAAGIAFCVLAFSPVSDVWYFGAALIAFLFILFTLTAIISKYNLLATRKLPQFNRSGGNDNA